MNRPSDPSDLAANPTVFFLRLFTIYGTCPSMYHAFLFAGPQVPESVDVQQGLPGGAGPAPAYARGAEAGGVQAQGWRRVAPHPTAQVTRLASLGVGGGCPLCCAAVSQMHRRRMSVTRCLGVGRLCGHAHVGCMVQQCPPAFREISMHPLENISLINFENVCSRVDVAAVLENLETARWRVG